MSKSSIETSDHYDGICFHNQNPEAKGPKSFYEVLKWKWEDKEKEEEIEFPQNEAVSILPSQVNSGEVFVTFINHAMVLIQTQGLTILTDPVFSDRIGPIAFLGFERSQKVSLPLSQLPKIDLVLISHNHYDHLDLPSIKQVLERDDPLFIVPLKNGFLLKKVGVQKIVELDWWEKYCLDSKQEVILTPAQHWSRRGLFDTCKSLWGGFIVVSEDIKVFFAGDTGYASHFQEIYRRFGKMDVSLVPIGCYKPRWFMQEQHMDPAEAVVAHLDLHSSLSIGIHFGTFKLADESLYQPVSMLGQALKNKGIPTSEFIAPFNGQTVLYTKEYSR